MPKEWYCKVMGEEIGPLSAQQMHTMASQGQLTYSDLVRNENSNWVSASRVKGLFREADTKEVVPPPINCEEITANSSADSNKTQSHQTRSSRPRLTTCPDCRSSVSISARSCPICGRGLAKSRLVACALAWLLGLTGAHKFYLGETLHGILYLLCTLTGVLTIFVAILAIADGCKYLGMSDEQFAEQSNSIPSTYRSRKKQGNKRPNIILPVCIGTLIALFIAIVSPEQTTTTRQNQSQSRREIVWSDPNMDTRGYSEKERMQIFQEFVRIEDRFPGNKAAQRPHFEALYKKYGIDEEFELQLLGEAIDKKWPMPK